MITLTMNRMIAPCTMAGVGVRFFHVLQAGLVPAADASQCIIGMILPGAACCTAMVFVWSQMTHGDASYTLVQVSINDIILIFADAPLVARLLATPSGLPLTLQRADRSSAVS